MNNALILSSWGNTCRRAETHAIMMAGMCLPEFAELIIGEVRKLTGLVPPVNATESDARNGFSMNLNLKISSIAHANSIARLNPDITSAILDLVTRFCDEVQLDSDVVTHSSKLTSQVSAISHSAAMARLRM